MLYVVYIIKIIGRSERLEFTNQRKAIDAFLKAVRKVKRKQLWCVQYRIYYPNGGPNDYWLAMDATQDPFEGRGLNDLPNTKILTSVIRQSRKSVRTRRIKSKKVRRK